MLWWLFWSILVHFDAPHGQPHNPSVTGTNTFPLSSVHSTQKWIMLVTQDKFETLLLNHAMVTILVHFGAPHGWPHHPSMTCSDSYPLSSFHLNQKWMIFVTEDISKRIILWCHAMVTIWIHFGPFWCISWATPQPLFIKFPGSHQRYVSYASRAFKRNQSHHSSSIHQRDIDLT